ncbi:MAG: ferrous iron transport protein A [Planctomycetota bacterium]|jgi:Fe2+ transport system protein FeoA
MPPSQRTLCDLKPGERGRVVALAGTDAIAARLMEMGLLPGEEVQHIGTAPMGDPIEFSVYGYRISLRREEALRVQIENPP